MYNHNTPLQITTNMLRVKTMLRPSSIHGMGLFAGQFIKKGTVTWSYDPEFDFGFTKKELDSLPKLSREFFLYYCYLDKKLDKFILCSDNQRYINHTENKKRENILSTPRKDVAVKNIKKGEELLCDYNKFDDSYFKRMHIPKKKLK